MELPQDLRAAIDSELAPLQAKKLAALAADLSKRYRTGQSPGAGRLLRSREDVAAYAAFRLPATYAAVSSVVRQVQDGLPHWNPKTLLDVGAGPGTAMWAAAALWPNLTRITLFERDEYMIGLGKRLAAFSSLSSVREAAWDKVDITGSWEGAQYDVVIASYSLGELPPDEFASLVHKLWDITAGALIIIEPGTPAGFSRIKQGREQLLAEGAKTVAPCPHDRRCPMAHDDWCHFAQRVARSRLHRQVKAAELSYEDEKFSFLSMSRTGGEAIQGRVIRHPQVRAGHIRLELCTPEGLTESTVTRKDRERFRTARDLRWGSAVPSEPGAD